MITEKFTAVWNELVKWGFYPETIYRNGELGIWVYVREDELGAIAALSGFPQIIASWNKDVNESYHLINGIWVEIAH